MATKYLGALFLTVCNQFKFAVGTQNTEFQVIRLIGMQGHKRA